MARKLKKNNRIKASKSNQSDGKDDAGNATSVPTSPVDDAQVEVPESIAAAVAATAEPAAGPEPAAVPPPPPPPPPPAPPLPTSPTFKAGPRVVRVRRQSTSGASPSARAPDAGSTSAHARSATDPSASTPNLPLSSQNALSKARWDAASGSSTPLPTLIAQAALKRSNTINSFGARRSPSPSSSPRNPIPESSADDGPITAAANGSGNDAENRDENTSSTSSTTNARRMSSPPPAIKPKPASLTLNNKTSAAPKKLVAHERSASALLRAALVQGASAAVQSNSGSGSGSNSKPGSNTVNGKPTISQRQYPSPGPERGKERKGSVAQLARSLESTLQFSAPPSPGTPPTLVKRSSVASNKSLKSIRSVRSVRNGNEIGIGEGEEDAERDDEGAEEGGDHDDGEDRGREEGKDEADGAGERVSSAPPPDFKAVVASLMAKGINANASTPSTAHLSPKPRPAVKKSAAAPAARAPSPPLTPPSSGKSEMFTAPESPPFSPPPDTPPPYSAPAPNPKSQSRPQRAMSTSPPPTPPSKAPKPKKFVLSSEKKEGGKEGVELEEAVSASQSPDDTSAPAPPDSSSSPALEQESEPQTAAAKDIDEPEKTEPAAISSTTSTDATSVPAPLSAKSKRISVPPSRPPPPPPEEPEAEDEAEEAAEESRAGEGKEVSPTPKDTKPDEAPVPGAQEPQTSTPKPNIPSSPPPPTPAKSAKRYSIPPPPRPLPAPPVEVDEEITEEVEEHVTEGGEGDGETATKPSKPQRPVPDLPPATPVDGLAKADLGDEEEDEGEEPTDDTAVLGGIVVQEPEEMDDELAGIVDEHGQVQLRLEGEGYEYDSANDSSDDDERYESYKSALSRNGSASLPPTPPTKHGASFPINLTSKWSRNTSAVQSANASASTLALEQTHLHSHAEAIEIRTDGEDDVDASLEDTTLAHINVHELTSVDDDAKAVEGTKPTAVDVPATVTVPEEDPMESRFKFPPVESFPPPQPLKRNTAANSRPANRKAMAFPNESEASLTSVTEEREDRESADDADRESTAPRNRKKSKTKAVLRTAVLAAFGKSAAPTGQAAEPIPEDPRSPTDSHAEGGETETATHSSDDDDINPLIWKMKARLAKLDANDPSSIRPTPFPTSGNGEHGQSQSAPEVPLASHRPGVGMGSPEDEARKRQVRLSSKLLPITSPARMNTSPSSITAWGKHKMVMSNETVGTIGTIATEPGDLEQSQFGLSTIASASESRAQSPPPSSFFMHRMKSDASRRPPVRRQTTSTSQASRFVEDLPFLKRSTSPTSMSPSQSQSPISHQRAATVSFSSRVRTGSMGTVMGPSTRKNSLIPELRAATIEAAERPMSAVSGDFVLVEEPEEFDIPRAEWDLPRIPSGSLRFPSTMDLRAKMAQAQAAAAANGNRNGNGRVNGRETGGPSSAPATTMPSIPMSPVMQHSRSETTGTTNTSGTSSTAQSSSSAPAAPLGTMPANGITFQVSSGSEHTIGGSGLQGGRLSSDALLDLWGRVGVYMSDAAALLHDKSRRVLVGDGTFPGFVLAVARQVPTACIPSKTARYPYGHLIYFQTAGTVHKRYAEILPGDVIVLQNALFKGVRGPLHQAYQEELGTKGDPIVGVIGEHEPRKSKVRVYQANQHVGMQTVEYVTYRFADLKSGTIKIFRVPDS